MRRIAALIDIADVLGVVGLIILAAASAQFDPRWPPVVVGVAVLLVAVAYAGAPRKTEATPPPKAE